MYYILEELNDKIDEIRGLYDEIDGLHDELLNKNLGINLHDYINDFNIFDYETLEDEIAYIKDNYTMCESCEQYLLIDESIITEDGEVYCDSCYSNNHTINSYHNYVISNYSNTNETIGLELETEFPSESNKKSCIDEYFGDFIMSNDGSLNHGVEFVSPIYNIKDLDEIEYQLKKINEVVVNNDGYCHDSLNSGLHVHVPLNMIGNPEDLWEFVYSNKTEFMCIGSRKAEFLAFKWCKPSFNLIRVGSHYEVDDRYCMLNINTKYDTCEFRFMNSNLKVNNLVIKIKFLLLLIDWINNYYTPNSTFDEFMSYVGEKNTDIFNYCIKWLNKRTESINQLIEEYFNY